MEMDNRYTAIREIPIDSLIIDPLFAGLFIEDPGVVARVTVSIKRNGYDEARPVDIWKDGAGTGRHVLVEGHQRYRAAQAAGQESIRVAYRHFDTRGEALMWAVEQQANRRNASKEPQCLSVLRALKRAGEAWASTPEMAERFGFSTATIDRARQVLDRGTESEILAVLDGTHGLKKAYELIRKREAQEAEPFDEGDDDHPYNDKKPQPGDVEALVDALDRRQKDRDELPEELHELLDRIGILSDNVYALGLAIENPAKLQIELRAVIEELIEVNDAITDAYPPGHTLTILIDGGELDEGDAKQMAKQGLKRCEHCNEVKPLAEFPTTPKGEPDRRRRGRGEWCWTCAGAPDATRTAGARRARQGEGS